MKLVILLGILLATGSAIVFTVLLANKALLNFFMNYKGLNQKSRLVVCPKCGTKNHRQSNGQLCGKCYTTF
ncbi:hypothetical protein ACOJQI_15865 [Bacillus salacetis]|uniref:hypothetical protein n=1 Tax=Bacillus salacetis TaxID=2315464 RepID=UPI003BA2A736